MSKTAWKAIAALAFTGLGSMAHGEVVKVFGLLLGGVPEKPVKVCPQDRDSPILCWINKTSAGKDGTKSGSVSLPEKDMPTWAAHTTSDMSLASNGAIAFISIDLRKDCNTRLVAESVTSRFGKPTVDRLQSQDLFKIVTWELKSIFIHLESAGSHCSISFRTPENIAAYRAYISSQNVNRPATP